MAQPAQFVDADTAHADACRKCVRTRAPRKPSGSNDTVVRQFLAASAELRVAIEQAFDTFQAFKTSRPELLAMDEPTAGSNGSGGNRQLLRH